MIVCLSELLAICQTSRAYNKQIVWVNGTFDLPHVGHVRLLKEAKRYGQVLVVGVNNSETVRELKGPGRPIQTTMERMEIVDSIRWVDYVISFSQKTPEDIIRVLKPEVVVKGKEYEPSTPEHPLSHQPKAFPEKAIIDEYRGRIIYVEMTPGVSTTNIINRLIGKQPGYSQPTIPITTTNQPYEEGCD